MIFTFYFWQWDTVRYTIYHIQYKIWTTVSLIQNVYLNTITCHEKMLAMSFSSKTSCFWPRRIKFSFIDQVGIQIFQFQGQMGHIKSIYWLIGKYSANSLLSKNGQPGLGPRRRFRVGFIQIGMSITYTPYDFCVRGFSFRLCSVWLISYPAYAYTYGTESGYIEMHDSRGK